MQPHLSAGNGALLGDWPESSMLTLWGSLFQVQPNKWLLLFREEVEIRVQVLAAEEEQRSVKSCLDKQCLSLS